jgi:hypothetical protein
MSEEMKRIIAIVAILFVLAVFALHSISTLALRQKTSPGPLPSSSSQTATAPSVLAPIKEAASASNSSVVHIPTAEEIRKSIEDQNQKRKAMEELIAARNKKAEKVMAEVAAAASQNAVSENTVPQLSAEARAERNKELRDGIKAHRYFPR